MKAPAEVQARLLDLQALDSELARIAAHRRRLAGGSDLSTAEAGRQGLRGQAADRRDVLEDLRSQVRRTESDVALVEQRLSRDRQRLHASTSPKDVSGLESEIASLLRRRSALEDAELELMEAVEAEEAALAVVQSKLEAADEHVARLGGDRDEALAGLALQQDAAERARATLVEALPGDLVALYDRQRTRYGVGAALLRGGVSGGSNVALTGADLAMVRAAAPDDVVLDPESGCILVRTADSGLETRRAVAGER